jgi:4-aminobutyrate aminotransferase-like enzyme
VYAELLDRGLIVNAVNGSTIRLVPPITVSDDEIDEAVTLIGDVLAESMEAALASSNGATAS